MKNRILQAALRIALLKEEFSKAEILKAIKLLQSGGSSSPLSWYLEEPAKESKKSARKRKPINPERSSEHLDDNESEYQQLARFIITGRSPSTKRE